jgi:hypothetical protein
MGLRRDRLGRVYLLNTGNAQLLEGQAGGDAFIMLPYYPVDNSLIFSQLYSVRSVTADRGGNVYVALNGPATLQGLKLSPGAAKWEPLPGNHDVGSPYSVEVDLQGNVYELGDRKTASGFSFKLPAGASQWIQLTGGPIHGISIYTTNMVADDAGNVFVVSWNGKTGYSLFELPAGTTTWNETAIPGAVYTMVTQPTPEADAFQRLAIDAKGRLIVSIYDDHVYRSRP